MIDNELKVDKLLNDVTIPVHVMITQEEYDLIPIKDHTKVYIITDSNDDRVYHGDIRIRRDHAKLEYLMGINRFDEYVIYRNERDQYRDNLIEIVKVNNPQDALILLTRFNKIGEHDRISSQVYSIIISYLKNDISLNDMILGIISAYGYRDDRRFQELLQLINIFNKFDSSKRDISVRFREELNNIKYRNIVCYFYYELYNLVVLYNHFKGSEFRDDPESLNLSKIIRDIKELQNRL